MSQKNNKKPEKCISPWYKYLGIVIVIVLTLFAIFEVESIDALDKIENISKNNTRKNLSVGNLLIASSGSNINSDVAVQFETSRNFIVVDPTTGEYKEYSNNWNSYNINQAKNYIMKNNVGAVITGTMNIDTYKILHSTHVAIYTGVTGKVDNAVEMYKNNKILPADISQSTQKNEPYSKSGARYTNRRVVL